MKLGTHNSMTYLKPKNSFLSLFGFMARCQRKDITEQYRLGARMFDIRISFTKEYIPEFRHGIIAYKGNVINTFKTLASLGDDIMVRLILENNKHTKKQYFQAAAFCKLCRYLEDRFTNIKFFCGRRKYDWYTMYLFKNEEPEIDQKVSSMTWKKWDDWFPWLYAKFMNRKNRAKANPDKWLLLDFIDIK